MPKYSKDIHHIIEKEEADELVSKAKSFRDKFLIAILYVTGARIGELCDLEKDDIKEIGNGLEITLKTEKLGNTKDFTIDKRILTILNSFPFFDIIKDYWKSSRFERLLNLTPRRARQIIDDVSDKRFCPNNFRHTRLTKLARKDATIDQLMFWKGAKDIRSVSAYLRGKKVIFNEIE